VTTCSRGPDGSTWFHDDGVVHGHAAGAIEWEDDMVEVNKATPANTRWQLVDRDTAAAGDDINWRFTVGDQVKVRLVNEMESDHRCTTRSTFTVPVAFWCSPVAVSWNRISSGPDTVLITPGQELDPLLEVTHPGIWMAHCHIAEHHESGMMFRFEVAPRGE
jgi:uncharacterized cupredoxin-like copper-binding protein